MPDGLAIVKRFDRIAAADGAAFLDPAFGERLSALVRNTISLLPCSVSAS
jgi:hypothetical protein